MAPMRVLAALGVSVSFLRPREVDGYRPNFAMTGALGTATICYSASCSCS